MRDSISKIFVCPAVTYSVESDKLFYADHNSIVKTLGKSLGSLIA